MILTQKGVRALMLAAQGLHRRPRRRATRHDVLEAIRNMETLQIDTINVVARSPYLVLWSRLGSYEQRWLDEHLAERRLFEYWAHEACFLPIEHYPLLRHRMVDPGSMGWKYSQAWMDRYGDEVERVRAHVQREGPVRSADFETSGEKGGTWWNWKPERRVLQMLFTTGELMVARRHNFQRLYDLRERILPDWSDDMTPTTADAHRELVLRSVRAIGVATERWVADYFRLRKSEVKPHLPRLVDEGKVLRVEVEGWKEPAYVHADRAGLAADAAAGKIRPTLTTLLSPFDPIVWDRNRALATFGFDYRIECYTPAPKRVYGYFTLPILRRGELIGRLDPKAHRKEGIFEVKAIHLEPGVEPTEAVVADIAGALRDCAAWHRTPEIVITAAAPKKLLAPLRKAVA